MSVTHWTEDKIVTAIRDWAEAHNDVPPSCITWRHAAPEHPSFVTVIERFGSFNAALEAGGYQPHRIRRTIWSRERIIEAAQSFHRLHGRPPTFSEWRRATPQTPNGSSVQGVFGSWNEMIAAAGFGDRGKRRVWTREEIVNELLDHLARENRWPTTTEWRRVSVGRPNASTVIRIFGTWRNALEFARQGEKYKLLVLAEPFAQAVRSYVAQSGNVELLGELAGVDSSLLYRLTKGQKTFLHRDTAEALAIAIDRPDVLAA